MATPTERPEDDLASRIGTGDAAAESDLVIRYRPGLLLMLRRRVGDGAEDVCQEALRIALQGLRAGRLRQSESLGPYLWGIAANLARQSWRRDGRLAPLGEPDALAHPGPSPEDQVLRGERAAAVREALRGLASRDREVLRRFYLGGEDKVDICRALGLSPSQFDVVKWRALRRLARACPRPPE